MAVKASASLTAPMPAKTTESAVEVQEHVRRRAYEIYEQRGKEDGHDLEDWLRAESEFGPNAVKSAAA